MRITVTLDDDMLALVQRRMRERGVSFKTALNDAIRDCVLGSPRPDAFFTRTANLGVPAVNLDGALKLATELENAELGRRQQSDS